MTTNSVENIGQGESTNHTQQAQGVNWQTKQLSNRFAVMCIESSQLWCFNDERSDAGEENWCIIYFLNSETSSGISMVASRNATMQN